MKKIITIQFLFCCLAILFAGCKEETVDYNNNNCKGTSAFIKQFGFQPNHSFLSTSDKRTMGLLLQELPDPNSLQPKKYQHPSWRIGGWLGPIQIDNVGNVFVGPIPFVNILNNTTSQQNTLYKVDGQSGVMAEFLKLPVTDSPTIYNPYGILGLSYLCETNTLYVSSVAGSTRTKEAGVIYAIDINEGKVIDKFSGVDILGMGISYIEGKRKLYFGSARNSDVYSITLDKKGTFTGKPVKVFSLENLGARGDDKVRKIRIDNYGNLNVYGVEFSFNLIAPTEKQETIYEFIYDDEAKKWNFSRILSNTK